MTGGDNGSCQQQRQELTGEAIVPSCLMYLRPPFSLFSERALRSSSRATSLTATPQAVFCRRELPFLLSRFRARSAKRCISRLCTPTRRTQRLVWLPWCDSRYRLGKHGGLFSALGLVDTRLLYSRTIERPVNGQSGILGDIRPACWCAHVIPAGKQLSGPVVLAVWKMKATYRQMWALEVGRVERDLECVSVPTLTNAGRP